MPLLIEKHTASIACSRFMPNNTPAYSLGVIHRTHMLTSSVASRSYFATTALAPILLRPSAVFTSTPQTL